MTNSPQFVGEHTLGRSDAPGGELVAFELPRAVDKVEYITDEVTSYCPVTGQPDFYIVTITLHGSDRGVESKSLKMYLQSFNDKEKAQFAEQFAETICKAVFDCVKTEALDGAPLPLGTTVLVVQKPRGGISIEATAHLTRGVYTVYAEEAF